MNNLQPATNELVSIINNDTAVLKPLLGSGWLFIGLPEKFPSITIDGIVRDDSKLTSYTAVLNLWIKDQDEDLIAYADRLLELLKPSNHFVCSGWLDRPEPENGIYRAMFPVTIYV